MNRPPLLVLNDLSAVLSQLDVLKAKRSKLLIELSGDKSVTVAQVQDFLALAKLSPNDIVAIVADFETLHDTQQ